MRHLAWLLVMAILSGCAARATSGGGVRTNTAVYAKHAEPVCLMKSPMPSNIKHELLGSIDSSKGGYGSTTGLLPVMAEEARKLGADAVVNMNLGHKVGMFSWAQPTGTGTAVKVLNRAELDCVKLGGEWR